MNSVVFGKISKPINNLDDVVFNNNHSISATNLLMNNTSQPASAPTPAPVPAKVCGGLTEAELLAKNNQLKNDVNTLTNKYNMLVRHLRSAGMIH